MPGGTSTTRECLSSPTKVRLITFYFGIVARHGMTWHPCSADYFLLASDTPFLIDSLQTPVYALYAVPTIVCAAILLTTRFLQIPLPSLPPNCWWDLFDAEWEDVWSVGGYIMRLYRPRSAAEQNRLLGMISKKGVRRWLDDNNTASGTGDTR